MPSFNSKFSGGGGALVVTDLEVDSPTLVIDETNNRVGVGTTTPAHALDVAGDVDITGGLSFDAGTAVTSIDTDLSSVSGSHDTLVTAKAAKAYADSVAGSGTSDLTDVSGTLAVSNGGTGATSLTDGGVLLGSGSGAVTATAVLANGELLIGDNSGDPTVATLTAGTGIDVSNGAGSITVAADVSDFMTNGSDNRVVTATGTDAMNAEANLSFDGSTLAVTGALTTSTTATVGTDLTVSGGDIAFGATNSSVTVGATAHDAAGASLTISAGPTTAGTSNDQAGGSLTISGGQGKGSGAGGDIVFKTANAGSSGSSLNSLATALTISDDKSATFEDNVTVKGDIILDDGGSLKEAGGTAAITFDGAGNVTKIGQDVPSTGQFLKYDGAKWVADAVASGSSAADDITTGDAAVTIATTSGDITIDAQDGDADIIFKGTDGGSDITALTLDMSDAGAATFNDKVTSTELAINHVVTNTSAGTYAAMTVDFDKTGASTSDNNLVGIFVDMDNTTATNGTNTMTGLLVTPTLTHANTAGSTLVKGLEITATGSAPGSTVARAIDLTATGADFNQGVFMQIDDGGPDIKMLSSADNNDFATIATGANGELTIATTDGGGTAAHVNIDADGDITLDADGGTITFADAGSSLGSITSSLATFAGDVLVSGGDVSFGNGQDATVAVATTGAGTDGRDLTIAAGSAPTGSANQNGGDLILASGGGDGNGTSIITFATKTSAGDSAAERMRINTNGNVVVNGSTAHASSFTVDGASASVALKEMSNAPADTGGFGQLWVKSESPNELYFTNDAGNDIRLTEGSSAAGGGGGTAANDVNLILHTQVFGR